MSERFIASFLVDKLSESVSVTHSVHALHLVQPVYWFGGDKGPSDSIFEKYFINFISLVVRNFCLYNILSVTYSVHVRDREVQSQKVCETFSLI